MTALSDYPAEPHAEAVRRALAFMRANLPEPQGLADHARAAALSPYHFHRVFRGLTGVTPGRFLTALRLAEAKRLLLCTSTSAAFIGSSVGYLSTGAFTGQFTRLVGLAPGRFRMAGRALGGARVADVLGACPVVEGEAAGRIRVHVGPRPDGTAGAVVLAAFPTGVPQDWPTTCTVVAAGTTGELVGPGPAHHVLGFSLPTTASLRQALLADTPDLYVGRADLPGQGGAPDRVVQLTLRAVTPFDPPLLTALPLLRPPPAARCSDAS
jgi:AraC-like DNA-binding protein